MLSELLVPTANHFVSEMGPCSGVNLTAVCKTMISIRQVVSCTERVLIELRILQRRHY